MTKHPFFKFLVGFTAGGCAVIFPKVTAALSVAGETSLFTAPFLEWAFLFACLIGVVVMILEWNVPKEPSATFMAALGIPALLAGGVNTTADTAQLVRVTQTNTQLAQELSVATNIPILPPVEIKPASPARGSKTDHSLRFHLTDMAYAADVNDPRWIAVPGQERRYVVVLDRAEDLKTAKQKEDLLHKKIPSLETEVVQGGNEYLIIESGKPLTKSDALLKAIRMKANSLNPQLLEIR